MGFNNPCNVAGASSIRKGASVRRGMKATSPVMSASCEIFFGIFLQANNKNNGIIRIAICLIARDTPSMTAAVFGFLSTIITASKRNSTPRKSVCAMRSTSSDHLLKSKNPVAATANATYPFLERCTSSTMPTASQLAIATGRHAVVQESRSCTPRRTKALATTYMPGVWAGYPMHEPFSKTHA